VLYAHEDAGGDARFFAFDESGADLGEYELTGATATDWEDIAVGPNGDQTFVFLADIGDNAARTGNGTPRDEIQVYRVAEPSVALGQSPAVESLDDWQVLRFTYPDAPHDAETLFVDPISQDLFFVTKEADGNARVFRAAADTPADTPTELEEVASYSIDGNGMAIQVSAGDISPTGDRIMLRTYTRILIWARAAGTTIGPSLAATPTDNPQPEQPQGEGITFSSDGSSWIAAGEQETTIYEGAAACP
jgi:hypothetical protein